MRTLAPRTSRAAGLIGACALAVLTLSGCIKVDSDLTVNPDATGTGTFAIELQKEAAGFLGITDLEAFRSELVEGDLSADSGLGVFQTCEASESDTGYVYSCSFADVAFTDPQDGPWTIAKDGDSLVFRMTSDAQDEAAAAGGDELLGDASLGSITVDVTFPGAITSLEGQGGSQTSDTTATVSGSLTDAIDVTITSETGSGGLTPSALLVVLVGVAVVALIVVVAVVLLMRRRGAGDAVETVETVETVEAPTEVVEVVDAVETDETDGTVETVETVEIVEAPAPDADDQPDRPATPPTA